MSRIKRGSKKSGPVKAKKVVVDGIHFASGLEAYMWSALKKANIVASYESHNFVLVEGFVLPNSAYERMGTGKGEYINRGNKKVLPIKYTPDFVGYDFIIETKGRANEAFPMRYKLFKKWIADNNDNRVLYKPQTHHECDLTVELILKHRNEKK